jgi:hypothetical protein
MILTKTAVFDADCFPSHAGAAINLVTHKVSKELTGAEITTFAMPGVKLDGRELYPGVGRVVLQARSRRDPLPIRPATPSHR